jgi:LuxR family transcriptional regulator, maltose regulon positive regulatory protein
VPVATIGRPRLSRTVVPRGALVDQLSALRDGALVAVTAPAGYGKTTLAATWDEADPRSFAWARLDHLDNDPAHLLLHLVTAAAGVCTVDGTVQDFLRGPGREPLTRLVPAVVAALERVGPLVLVLDDVHHLEAADAVATLHALLDEAPATTLVAVLGRDACPLQLARRRLTGDVLELDAPVLRLTDREAATVVESISGIQDPATTEGVIELCEGWAAGLVLAGLACRDGARIDSLSGRRGPVGQYLVEEVLDRLDPDTVTFILESSVLDRFSADQLDAVLGRADSAAVLDDLCTSIGGLLVALDPHRRWFRYHRLMGDILRDRLRVSAPNRFRALAIRASVALERDGDIDAALVQASAAGDRPRAAALVGRDAVRLGFDGRAGVLARRLAMLDAATFVECPDAAVAQAWLGVTTGDAEMIRHALLLAHCADRGMPLSDGTPSVRVAAALVGSMIGVGGVHDVLRQADVVRAAGDHSVNPWWGAATIMMGAAESMLGHTATARVLLESAVPVTENLPGFQAAALAHLALLDLGAGDDETAIERSEAAQMLADKYDLCDLVPMVVVYATSAVMSARLGDASAARSFVARTERLLNRLGGLAARTALLGHGLLAWTAAVLQDEQLLRTHLGAADSARRREPEAVALAQRVDRVRAMAGRGGRPLTAAELRLLPHLATHLTLQQIADVLVVGRETTKSQATSIYRKLGVSSRTDAVAEARRLGLLPDQ